ncbi:hypothetical protein BACCOPRO_03561 [Phocaeicola coprophilus DSM 18228 = JCM 13818]|uniref:Uncharacterized protein n=1 Tax=Phocaeicola coprophilus DSM 18228 = JCM 13818 TaxID=547042 RepID=S0FC44_9BACT|nr:hypothetical protein BACCOPRO_03561 [Phocaeicola coprophilus DSM 18228 = JCM 13818]
MQKNPYASRRSVRISFFQGGQTCQLIANFVPSLSSIETS